MVYGPANYCSGSAVAHIILAITHRLLYHFFAFCLPTPPVSRPKLPRLDLGLWSGPPGVGALCVALPALEGRNVCLGASGSAFSLSVSRAGLGAGVPSSMRFCDLCSRLAFSCTLLNFSSKSPHLIVPSSLAFSRFGRSNAAVGVGGVLPI